MERARPARRSGRPARPCARASPIPRPRRPLCPHARAQWDLLAGITVGFMVVPQGMSYAILAGERGVGTARAS
jgi:hypothetical protein